jgi:hypothetical protein
MPAPSNTHRALTEAAALYCRFAWQCWPVAIEATGLADRNYDAVAIKTSPRSIVVFETKKSRKDFLSGLKAGQFNKSPYATEMWFVYPGNFDIPELPSYIGIMSPRNNPICDFHEKTNKQHLCSENCKFPKTIFLKIERPARMFWDKDLTRKYWHLYTPKWLWRIAVSNTTKYINIIAANIVPDIENFKNMNKNEE